MYFFVGMLFAFFYSWIIFTLGSYYGAVKSLSVQPINIVSYSRADMYNVLMLKNCFQELKTLKGGEK